MIELYALFSLLLTVSYLFLIKIYLSIWGEISVWKIPANFHPTTTITILIPARNEAANIETCLHSIAQNNYPKELFEIIVIDDFSSDTTPSIVNNLSEENENIDLKLLQLADFIQEKNSQSFKKRAIELGISKADGEVIITTDADCIVPPNWLLHLISFYQKNNLKFIAAPVNFHQEKSLLEKFQSLDFMGMMMVTGAGISSTLQKMCNGANLAYSKKAFQEVNGFQGIDHLASGDDMFLMHKMVAQFPKQIGFLKNQEATVFTAAQSDLGSFIAQRLRWATKNASYTDWKVTAVLALVFFFCCNILLSGILSFIGNDLILLSFFIQVFGKTIADYFFLKNATTFFKRTDLMRSFLPAQILHLFYIVGIGILANFKKEYTWKNRKVR